MSEIYSYITGETLFDNLQGSDVCGDENLLFAKCVALENNECVMFSDDDGEFLVYPDGKVEEYCIGGPEDYQDGELIRIPQACERDTTV